MVPRVKWLVLLPLSIALAAPGYAQKGSRSARASSAPKATSAQTPRASKSAVPRASKPAAPKAIKGSVPKATKSTAPKASEGGVPVTRDKDGRIVRSETAKHAFESQTGHPGGWSGHVVDHIVPLACGGSDSPSNMQWQTAADGKAKDKVERRGCGRGR